MVDGPIIVTCYNLIQEFVGVYNFHDYREVVCLCVVYTDVKCLIFSFELYSW